MDSLVRGIADLLRTGNFSDLEVKCGGESFKVHRAVVCTRSTVMARQCSGGFMVSQVMHPVSGLRLRRVQGVPTRVIHHSTFGPSTFKRMLQFMYTGDYDGAAGEHPDEGLYIEAYLDANLGVVFNKFHTITAKPAHQQASLEELRLQHLDPNGAFTRFTSSSDAIPTSPQGAKERMAAHIYAHGIADYYEVPDLRDLAARKFDMEVAQLEYITATDFVQIAATVYANTPPDIKSCLRQAVLKMALGQRARFMASKEFLAAIGTQTELQQFAADFLKALDSWHEERYESFQVDEGWSTGMKRIKRA